MRTQGRETREGAASAARSGDKLPGCRNILWNQGVAVLHERHGEKCGLGARLLRRQPCATAVLLGISVLLVSSMMAVQSD